LSYKSSLRATAKDNPCVTRRPQGFEVILDVPSNPGAFLQSTSNLPFFSKSCPSAWTLLAHITKPCHRVKSAFQEEGEVQLLYARINTHDFVCCGTEASKLHEQDLAYKTSHCNSLAVNFIRGYQSSQVQENCDQPSCTPLLLALMESW